MGTGRDPRDVFRVSNHRGFAAEVKAALLDEAEDGSSILSRALDEAMKRAIEDGSQFWINKDESEPKS